MKLFSLVMALLFLNTNIGLSFADKEDSIPEKEPIKEQLKTKKQENPSIRPWKKGKSMLGIRFGQKGAFGGSLSGGLNYEYMYNDIFGFATQFMYAAYNTTASVGDLGFEIKNQAYTIVALGNFHPGFIHIPSFDPFISLGLAYSFISTKISSTNASNVDNSVFSTIKVDSNATNIVGSLNARYFIDKNLGVVGSLSFGLSRLSIGLDYLF